jgi:hypothetical protein
LSISLLATFVGFVRDRTFHLTLLIVIASYYGLLAVMAGTVQALAMESIVIVGFLLVSTLGFTFNLWLVVGALFAHGIFDFFHVHFISNPGVPARWPMFCLAYDITTPGYLAWLLIRSKMSVKSWLPQI